MPGNLLPLNKYNFCKSAGALYTFWGHIAICTGSIKKRESEPTQNKRKSLYSSIKSRTSR